MPVPTILREEESYRLISDGSGRYAVIEARAGHVYSLHPMHRAECPDCPEGMLQVAGPDGWSDEPTARGRFEQMVRGERRYAERIW